MSSQSVLLTAVCSLVSFGFTFDICYRDVSEFEYESECCRNANSFLQIRNSTDFQRHLHQIQIFDFPFRKPFYHSGTLPINNSPHKIK